MSANKTLGQIAAEARMGFSLEPWEPTGLAEQSWECAAQAVKRACGNTQEGIEQSQTTWRAGFERGLAQGAAEERERLASIFDEMPAGKPDMTWMAIADAVRRGGKP